MAAATLTLDQLHIDNSFIDTLPGDPNMDNRVRQVANACYSFVNPRPAADPKLVAWSSDMLKQLNLTEKASQQEDFLQLLCGNQPLSAMRPYAMCYGGHQFGHWAGQLGDGRAILLGDVINRDGKRWSLQLKGAGPTPYSRSADGLAVLRSSLREFLCSEAMHHLGVPTTRALSLVLTGESVVRDMFYDGNPQYEPGAVVCRVAPSFTRFGNFQIFNAQQDYQTLKQLADYTIRTDFPHLGDPSAEVYRQWFDEVCMRTADMIVHWMRVGFVHGVMNTDNMSILGLTIDYGPYGWLEDFDPEWTPNTTDANGRRYRFGHQPMIAQWNLLQLAEALFPLINDTQPLEDALHRYSDVYNQQSQVMYADKLGFPESDKDIETLNSDLLKLLTRAETDMTLFYRLLASLDLSSQGGVEADLLLTHFEAAWYVPEQIDDKYLDGLVSWLQQYQHCLRNYGISERDRTARMNRVNPLYVLRNYLAQLAIDKVEQGDYSMLHEMLELYQNPYQEQAGMQQYAERRPEWARHRAGCSMLSCSS